MRYIETIPQITPLLQEADHVDVKTIESTVSLREFLAAMFSYQPNWVTFLYGVRAVFVRFLGMKQGGIPRPRPLTPEKIAFTSGSPAYFFKVRMALENAFYVAEIKDKHLDAMLGVVVEPLQDNRKRFHVLTIVNYNNWAGPIYFNVIRPIHHVVVKGMARAGARGV
ncbi:MAG: DUF2867 domain-containing protein [Anaerolineaceae bacterium]|nr:DUF2867 domain-containing protein [Anaerolineaceae bacterium]